jgi:hypothetical protein
VLRPTARYVGADDGVVIAYSTVGDGPVPIVVVAPMLGQLEIAWEERRSSSSSTASLRERPSSCLIGGAAVCPATDRFDRQDLLHEAHDAARGAGGGLASAHRIGLAAQGDAILTDIATITGLLARPTRRQRGQRGRR